VDDDAMRAIPIFAAFVMIFTAMVLLLRGPLRPLLPDCKDIVIGFCLVRGE
jgi:hypothetical protein